MKTVYFFGGLHPIQESIIKYPVEGYQVISNIHPSDFDIVGEYTVQNKTIKKIATRFFNVFHQPRLIYITKKCDLIHTTSGVIPLNHKPFVVGAEYYSSFVGLQHDIALTGAYLKNTRRFLLKDNCKKILPFSEASRQSIINGFQATNKDLLDKIEVLYPAMKAQNLKIKKDHDSFKILHIGSAFFEKGGRELFKAVDILHDIYEINVEVYTITNAPKHYEDEYKKFIFPYRSKNHFHIIERKIPRVVLFENYYPECDVFVFPSYGDFFGYVLLEAMACGLPVIGTDVFAVPEIIDNEKNGFLIKTPISPFGPGYLRKKTEDVNKYLYEIIHNEQKDVTNELVEKLLILINDKNIRKKFSENSYEMIKNGKFSIAYRNNQLKKIYDEALKGN